MTEKTDNAKDLNKNLCKALEESVTVIISNGYCSKRKKKIFSKSEK